MSIPLRRRTILAAALGGAALAALGVSVASSHAAGGELATSNLNTPAGEVTPLQAGVAYTAASFPIPISVTAPDGSWGGSQWTTSSHGKPAFAWVALAGPPGAAPNAAPKGIVEIVTPIGASPAVSAILARLRSAGGGATFGPTRHVRLAGFPAWQIDGHVYGRFGHVFVPFTPKTGGASPPDSERLDPREDFRLIAADVRGRRVVVVIDSAALEPGTFPTFLAEAGRVLATLRFPAS
jgi:hypothetical protein